MAAAEPADLTLHTALLMRPLDTWGAEEGVVAVMGAHRHEPGMLKPFPAQGDPDHRRLQIVIADHPGRHPTEGLEGPHMPIQERFLGLVGISEMARLPRVRQPHTKHVQLHDRPRDRGGELAKINLGLGRRRMGLRHHHLAAISANLGPQPRHQIPHRRLPNPGAFLLGQPLPNPPRGMPLLPRRRLILHQPAPNKINIGAGRRS